MLHRNNFLDIYCAVHILMSMKRARRKGSPTENQRDGVKDDD